MKRQLHQAAPVNRAAKKLRKNLLRSLRAVEKAFRQNGNPAIAEFRRKLNAL